MQISVFMVCIPQLLGTLCMVEYHIVNMLLRNVYQFQNHLAKVHAGLQISRQWVLHTNIHLLPVTVCAVSIQQVVIAHAIPREILQHCLVYHVIHISNFMQPKLWSFFSPTAGLPRSLAYSIQISTWNNSKYKNYYIRATYRAFIHIYNKPWPIIRDSFKQR